MKKMNKTNLMKSEIKEWYITITINKIQNICMTYFKIICSNKLKNLKWMYKFIDA